MNWLAHAVLSKTGGDFRLGNFLTDLVRKPDRVMLSAAFLQGVRQHQAIDAFTDLHPVVGRSRGRISPAYRRVSGILVDIFYDHFLALDWERYCRQPLGGFIEGLYADLQAFADQLPADVQHGVTRMVGEDWLGSYRTVDGIESSLARLSVRLMHRTGHDFALVGAIGELVDHFDALHEDFAEFFPELQTRVNCDNRFVVTGAP